MGRQSLEERQAEMRDRLAKERQVSIGTPIFTETVKITPAKSLRRVPSAIEVSSSSRHRLVNGAQELFENCRISEVGYLRPLKRNLVDILVTKELLPYALDTANLLFSQLETRGHSVGLAPSGSNFQRPPLRLYEGQNFDITRETWWPARETVASFGSIAFGLTIYEMTESADVVYQWDGPIRYVRTSQLTGKRRSTWADSIRKEHMPCGRLALRAYSPYHGATWEQHWGESKPGELVGIFETIVKRLKGAVPTIVAQIEAARKQAEIEHQRWQAQWEEFQRQERKRKQEQALKESRQHLLSIVEAWSLARNIEGFFEDAEQRAKGLPESDNARILDRLKTARLMLGGTDALRRFAEWKSASDLVGSE